MPNAETDRFRFVVLPTEGIRFDTRAASAQTRRTMAAMGNAIGESFPITRSAKVKVVEASTTTGLN